MGGCNYGFFKRNQEMKSNKLHLILTHHWYDMIQSGAKRTEYRDFTMRYAKLLRGKTEVTFHRGYSNTTMKFKITGISVRFIDDEDIAAKIAPKEWLGRPVWAIYFEEMEEENETQTLD